MTNALIASHPRDLIVPTKLPDTALVVNGALRDQIAVLYQRMGDQPDITDAATFESMRTLVRDASQLKNLVEACRALAKAPSMAIGKAIDRAAAEIIKEIDLVITEGKNQETFFLVERDKKLAEERARFLAAEIAAQKDQSRPTAPLSQLAPSEIIKAPLSTRRVVIIDNPALVPDDYWIIDRPRLDADVLAGKIVLGVRVEEQKFVVAR